MKNKGISLITLVITIIVIIILTGAIVLSMSGNNPILKTSEAVFKNDISEIKQGYESAYTNYVAANSGAEPSEVPFDIPSKYANEVIKIEGGVAYVGTDSTKMQWAASQGVPIIPSGFHYVGGSVDNGMVVSDNIADLRLGASHTVAQTLAGNQFVWVPVNKIEGGYTNSVYNTDSETYYYQTNFFTILEPTPEQDGQDVVDYTGVETSINRYGGFYVARYEASAASVSGSTVLVASKKSNGTRAGTTTLVAGNLLNWITYDNTIGVKISTTTNSLKGALKLSKEFAGSTYTSTNYNKTAYTSVNSNLVTDKQYDTIIKWMRYVQNPNKPGKTFIQDCSGMRNETGSLANTGSLENTKIKNIYDIVGNLWEKTTQVVVDYDDTARASIDGGWGQVAENTIPGGYAYGWKDTLSNEGFRPALYIK